jgi:hypothetical protein
MVGDDSLLVNGNNATSLLNRPVLIEPYCNEATQPGSAGQSVRFDRGDKRNEQLQHRGCSGECGDGKVGRAVLFHLRA